MHNQPQVGTLDWHKDRVRQLDAYLEGRGPKPEPVDYNAMEEAMEGSGDHG